MRDDDHHPSPRPHQLPEAARSGAPQRPRTDAPTVLLLWGTDSAAHLSQLVDQLVDRLAQTDQSKPPDWAELDPAPCQDVTHCSHRLALVTDSPTELADQLERTAKFLESGEGARSLVARHIHLGQTDGQPGKLAMLFPGQGSQYPGMLYHLARQFPVVAETLAEADEVLKGHLPQPLTGYLAPPREGDHEEATNALKQTVVTQPAMLACDVALLRLLANYNVVPELVAGHSLGEYAAGVAAGVLSYHDALRAVAVRAQAMVSATPPGTDPGAMAAVAAPADAVAAVLDEVPGYVIAANKNSPRQTIISGETQAVADAVACCAEKGWPGQELPLSHAFHSRIVAQASSELAQFLQGLALAPPALPVVANVTGREYPSQGGESVVDLLARQVMSPVEFMATVERLYELGGRTFLEVGPRKTLTSLVRRILRRRPHQALSTNHPDGGDARCFFNALAALAAAGYPLRGCEQ